ncbi:MAG: redox-sensing transcriptional repressor Rex [Ruminococcaceae bacterium]|nr:redox-sensing transcriptional repressor Rex [Oscillospiraceae bacterium]
MEHIDKVSGTFDKRVQEAAKPAVSAAVIKRLPRYHRYLGDLIAAGRLRISSAELSKIMNVTASQIRQDLNCFGGFGQQGYGYNIKYLYGKISELLGVNEGYSAVIVGAGNLGRALASTRMFSRRGVNRLALFDIDESIIGTEIYGIKVYSVDELFDFCQREKVDIGVLTVPKEAAHAAAKTMAAAGVKGIWNFANMELSLDDDSVVVENIHLGDSLMTLCYEIKTRGEEGADE